jgi:type II secretory pathway component PulF
MTQKMFPTFSRWFLPLDDDQRGVWRLRGPTWYITTWLGDSLATQQRSLLRVLAVAHQERLELAPLIQCLAEEHRGRYRRLLKRLAQRIQTGSALVDALEQTPDALDDDTVLALRFGSQSGTTQAAFAMLLSRDAASETERSRNVTQTWVYWAALACSIAFLLTVMMVLIAPTFKKMFFEFGLNLPTPLRILIAICDGFAHYAVLWILLGIVIIGLFWSSTVRRFFRRQLAPMFVQPMAQLRKSELLKLLAIGVDSGRPLAGSLSTLARYHFDPRVRQRLLFARNEIEQGVESWQGLTEAELLTQQQSVAVATAPTNEIRAWILQQLATGMQKAAQRKTSIGFALLQPVVVLAFGAVVMFIFISFFSVLVLMISSLS